MAKNKKNSSKELNIKKKILNSLIKEKKDIDQKIKNSESFIDDVLNKKISEESLNKLPIESLKDLYLTPESITEILDNHSKERKKRLNYLNMAEKIDHQINQAKIDCIIEKINIILKNLN